MRSSRGRKEANFSPYLLPPRWSILVKIDIDRTTVSLSLQIYLWPFFPILRTFAKRATSPRSETFLSGNFIFSKSSKCQFSNADIGQLGWKKSWEFREETADQFELLFTSPN